MLIHQGETQRRAPEREVHAPAADVYGAPGESHTWVEELPIALFQYFLLHVEGRTWLGRESVPESRAEPHGILQPSMLMGEFEEMGVAGKEVSFRYIACTPQEREEVFVRALAAPDADIDFPFPRADAEWDASLSADYRDGGAALAESLDADEEHLREFSAHVLRGRLAPGDAVFDPACSTGAHAAALAREFPECVFTISDASPRLLEAAARRVPGALVADATDSPVAPGSVKALVLRRPNAEAFPALVGLLAPGGHALVLGHASIDVPVRTLARRHGLKVLSTLGARPGRTELFPYYLLLRPEND
ncbi:class I SAM-dependent methyltransferase [Streptomyces sp. NPDC050504]|uniref:class I SAM-dependent methyltransferase n=1 Tax=Streptomyces sp. NPDC050504 TaxID=3365618 RepID=UPI0037887478